MKKLLLSLAILALSFAAKAQQIDTTVRSIASVGITPIKANFTDQDSSSFLGIRVIADNLVDNATLYFCFLTDSASGNKITFQGNYTLSGENYAKWCNPVLNPNYSCAIWPFVVVGNAYGLTFSKPNIPPATGVLNKK